jgi:hypothetical protein
MEEGNKGHLTTGRLFLHLLGNHNPGGMVLENPAQAAQCQKALHRLQMVLVSILDKTFAFSPLFPIQENPLPQGKRP